MEPLLIIHVVDELPNLSFGIGERLVLVVLSNPKAQARFETTAEVLRGLMTAYEHFEQRGEQAWR